MKSTAEQLKNMDLITLADKDPIWLASRLLDLKSELDAANGMIKALNGIIDKQAEEVSHERQKRTEMLTDWLEGNDGTEK